MSNTNSNSDNLKQLHNKTGMFLYDIEDKSELYKNQFHWYNSLYGRQRTIALLTLLEKIKLDNANILEIGPGAGLWSAYLSKSGHSIKIHLLDIRNSLLQTASDTMQKYGSGLPQNTYLGDIESFELPKNFFDVVFCKDVIEHLQNDSKAIQNIYNSLKPKGMVIITTQNNFSINYLFQCIIHKYIRKEKNWCGWDTTHLRFYNVWKIKSLLIKNGLVPLYYVGSYHFPYLSFFRKPLNKLYIINQKDEVDFPICKELLNNLSLIKKIISFPEYLKLCDYLPFSITRWNIGVLAQKV